MLDGPPTDDENARMPERSLGGVDRRALDGIRVLLVEDTDDARELLAFVLEQCAARVTSAANAAEGFEAFLRERPQIVVTDLAMPGHDGYWLLRQVRAHAKAADVPAVALTAYTERYSRDQVLAAGFDAWLPKPIDPSDLCSALRRVLRGDH
jgi:CheY-like chemotaxis protein